MAVSVGDGNGLISSDTEGMYILWLFHLSPFWFQLREHLLALICINNEAPGGFAGLRLFLALLSHLHSALYNRMNLADLSSIVTFVTDFTVFSFSVP